MPMMLALIFLIALCYLVSRSSLYAIHGLNKAWVIGAFLLKVLAGLLLWVIYTRYYTDAPRETLDTFKYFDDAGFFHSALYHDPVDWFRLMLGFDTGAPSLERYYEGMNNWQRADTIIAINDNKTMIRFNALIRLISFGEYHVHSVVFNFLGFTGLVLLFKSFRRLVDLPAWVFLIAFILPPSLLFWGSGVLKEGVVFFAMGIFFHGFFAWYDQRSDRHHLLAMILGSMLFVSIKPYVLLAFMLAILFMIWTRTGKGRVILKWLVLHLVALVAVYFSKLHDKLDLVGILRNKRDAFVNVARDTGATSAIDIPRLDSYGDWLLALPTAITNTLFRPTVLEASSALLWMAALENIGYIMLLIIALIWRRKTPLDLRPLLFCLSVVVVMSAIVGLVTPVLGAVVRYKVPLLPFLLLMTLLVVDLDRLKGYFPHLRR